MPNANAAHPRGKREVTRVTVLNDIPRGGAQEAELQHAERVLQNDADPCDAVVVQKNCPSMTPSSRVESRQFALRYHFLSSFHDISCFFIAHTLAIEASSISSLSRCQLCNVNDAMRSVNQIRKVESSLAPPLCLV